MMGPRWIYRDRQHLEEILLALVDAGLDVTRTPRNDGGENIGFRQRWGLMSGVVQFDRESGQLVLGDGHPFLPFLWWADSRVHGVVERMLHLHGAKCVDWQTEVSQFDEVACVLPASRFSCPENVGTSFARRIWRSLSSLFYTETVPREFGMTDRQFVLAVLDLVPSGSTLELHQLEPDAWIDRLRPWSVRKKADQFEADHYVIGAEFLAEFRSLQTESQDGLDSCHELSVMSPRGDCLMDSQDSFTIVYIDESIRRRLGTGR